MEGCDRTDVRALPYCEGHRSRVRQLGHPDADRPLGVRRRASEVLGYMERTLAERTGDEGCWLDWPFIRNVHGYATVTIPGGAHVGAFRHALTMLGTPIPEGLIARHTCGNGRHGCWNPYHIVPGTHLENAHDKLEHGTYGLKLTADDVLEIRQAYANGELAVDLATRFDTHESTVHVIVAGRSWSNIPVAPTPTNLVDVGSYRPPAGSQCDPLTFALVAAAVERSGELVGVAFPDERHARKAGQRMSVRRNYATRRHLAGRPLTEYQRNALHCELRHRDAYLFARHTPGVIYSIPEVSR